MREARDRCLRKLGAFVLVEGALHISLRFSETVAPAFGTIQAHALQPQAARLPFSSQTSAIAILTR